MHLINFIQILNKIFSMSNLANYSPHNKSFKFIFFQNQAYHQSNKRNAKPCIRSNIRYKKSPIQSTESNNLSFLNNLRTNSSKVYNQKSEAFQKVDLSSSMLSLKSVLSSEKRVVHKNSSFEKFEKYKIMRQNEKMAARLLNSNCQIIKNQKSKQSFQKHLKYKQIRRLYNNKNILKQQLVIPNQKLLCPTLSQYRKSGSIANDSQIDFFSNCPESPVLKRPLTTTSSLSKKKSYN